MSLLEDWRLNKKCVKEINSTSIHFIYIGLSQPIQTSCGTGSFFGIELLGSLYVSAEVTVFALALGLSPELIPTPSDLSKTHLCFLASVQREYWFLWASQEENTVSGTQHSCNYDVLGRVMSSAASCHQHCVSSLCQSKTGQRWCKWIQYFFNNINSILWLVSWFNPLPTSIIDQVVFSWTQMGMIMIQLEGDRIKKRIYISVFYHSLTPLLPDVSNGSQ